jgi:hypothetical protein
MVSRYIKRLITVRHWGNTVFLWPRLTNERKTKNMYSVPDLSEKFFVGLNVTAICPDMTETWIQGT